MNKRIQASAKPMIFAFVVFALLFFAFPHLKAAAAAEQRSHAATSDTALTTVSDVTLKVAFPIVEGMSEISDNGQRRGIIVDYLNEISNYTGWQYEYINVDDASKMLSDFESGKFDLMGGTYYKPVLESVFAYPKYNSGYIKSVLLARWEDDSIKSYDLSTFNGKKIGVYKNAEENVRRLKQYLQMNDLNCELVYYEYADFSQDGNLYPYLESGEVDFLLGNASEAGKEFKAVASFNSQPHYIVAQKNNPQVLRQLNDALEKIYESNPNFSQDVYDANFDNIISANIRLTQGEKDFIAQSSAIKIAVPDSIHPLFCHYDASSHNGILYDLMEAIGEKTGLKYEFVLVENFAHAVAAVRNGEADVAGIFLDDVQSATERGMALTHAYTDVNMMLLKNKKVTYPAENLTVAVVEGRELPDEIDATLISYRNITDALNAVNRGKVDLVYGMSSLMEKVIQEKYFSNLVPVSLNESVASVKFAVNKPVSSPLFTVLNKAIGMFGEDELISIVNQNMESIGTGGFSLTDFIYANPFMFISIVSALLLLVIVIIIIAARFRIRSANMQLELEKYTADSRAKSEFLSRMSHEIRTPMNAVIGLTDLTMMKEGVPDEIMNNLSKIRSSSHYLLSLLNDILDMSRIDSGMMTVDSEPFSLSRTMDELNSMMSAQATRHGITLSVKNDVDQDMVMGDSIRLRQVLANLVSNAVKFTPSGGSVEVSVESGEGADVTFSVTDSGCGIAEEDKERVFRAFEQAGNSYSKSRGTGLGLSISQSIVKLMGGQLQLSSEAGKGSKFFFTIPLQPTTQAEQSVQVEDGLFLKGLHILLAEDNDLNAEIAQDILAMAGATSKRVADGEQAVKEFSLHAEQYNAVLMDIQMPLMNGLDAARAIRKLSSPHAASVPIIAMTANSFVEDTQAATDAGMNYFISKPIDINLLYSALKEIKND